MKIIKQGIEQTKAKRFECAKCGCIFEANKDEYRFTDVIGQLHDNLPAYYCRCPNCRTDSYAD